MATQRNIWRTPADYDQHAALIQERNAEILANMALQHMQEAEAVLDLGSGTGALLSRLCAKARFERSVALDISGEMLARGRERLRDIGTTIEFVQGDFMTTAIEGQFSLIASNAALHWFDEDMERVFAKLVSLAKPKGIIAIATAGTCDEVKEFDEEVMRAVPASVTDSFSRRRVDEQRLRQLAERQGLGVLDSFLLLRSTTMSTSAYATWLTASGVMMHSPTGASASGISALLERHFGNTLVLRHCSVFGVFQNLHG